MPIDRAGQAEDPDIPSQPDRPAVHRNGKKAHVDAPGISADFIHSELVGFLTDTVTSWADTR